MIAAQAGDDESNPVVVGSIAIGKMLIARFPESIGIKDKSGTDSLLHTARYGTFSLCQLLLSRAYEVLSGKPDFPNPMTSHIDHLGNTPLHYASAFGHLKVVRALVDAGADPMARNAAMWTTIDYSFSVAAEVYLKNLMKEKNGVQGGKALSSSPMKKAPMVLLEREISDWEEYGGGNAGIGRVRNPT